MFTFWYKKFPHLPAHHADFHRAKLIYHLLLFVCILASFVTVLNLFVFDAADIAIIDAIGLAISLGIYLYFRSTGDVATASWAITITFTIVLAAFFTIWGGNNYGVLWATVIPPVAFFLLGRRNGTWVTAIIFSYALYIVYGHVNSGLTYQLSMGAVFNVLEVLVAHIMLFRFYERTRADAMLQLQESREQLRVIATTDKLTGLNNRQRFDQELQHCVARAIQNQHRFALLLIDVDHFKYINDEQGHLFGDSVLKRLGDCIKSELRGDDFLARWGGEEFAVLMPNTNAEQALQRANRLRELVAKSNILNQQVTFSGGVAVWQEGMDAEELLGNADKALYQAKQDGRNRIQLSHY